MRIIGGKYKRRRFDVPKSFNARPTTDFAKENLFNVLQQYLGLEGLTALDLFSGTGSIALELLSRGCSRVVALEQRREHALFIRSVVRELGEERSLQVLQADVFRYLATAKGGAQYDFSALPYFSERRVYGSVNFSIFALEDPEAQGEDSAEEP